MPAEFLQPLYSRADHGNAELVGTVCTCSTPTPQISTKILAKANLVNAIQAVTEKSVAAFEWGLEHPIGCVSP